ncbi:MAG: class I SAM-dependent methyltransferase [Patescibacteria group bacterium]
MISQELAKKLDKVKSIFDIEDIVKQDPDDRYIKKYYKTNKIPYSIFHTPTDLIYMGISRDGKYNRDDLLEQARVVNKYIKRVGAKKVLELATGRGANSYYLSKQNPNTEFYGIDISETQLNLAKKKAKKVPNYFPRLGNYNNLEKFDSSSFEVVFIVEALCYSNNKSKVLCEIYRILKPGGFFLIFDGYQSRTDLDGDEKLACELTAKGMALKSFETYTRFVESVGTSRLTIHFEEDVSEYVLPTMKRFEKLARIYFTLPLTARIAKLIFPKEFVNNSIPAYFMPTLVKDKIACYMITILTKPLTKQPEDRV